MVFNWLTEAHSPREDVRVEPIGKADHGMPGFAPLAELFSAGLDGNVRRAIDL